MKNLLTICLILIFGFSPGLAQANNGNTQEQAVVQLVHELSLATS